MITTADGVRTDEGVELLVLPAEGSPRHSSEMPPDPIKPNPNSFDLFAWERNQGIIRNSGPQLRAWDPVAEAQAAEQRKRGTNNLAMGLGGVLVAPQMLLARQTGAGEDRVEEAGIRGLALVELAGVRSGRSSLGRRPIQLVRTGPVEISSTGIRFGRRTPIPPADPETIRSLILENQSADILAKAGYRVQQNPKVEGPKNPDYKINGLIYDNYAPANSIPRSIWTTVKNKVTEGQAPNMVLNLRDSNVHLPSLREQFAQWPIEGFGQAIVIDKFGNLHIIKGAQ